MGSKVACGIHKIEYLSSFTLYFSRFHTCTGLYKGWAVTSSRAAILTSAQLGSYDTIKNNLLIKSLGMQEGFLLHLVASMASGLITTTAANPGKNKNFNRIFCDPVTGRKLSSLYRTHVQYVR
jgi:hypothetical protein